MEEVMVSGRMVMSPNGSATVRQHNPVTEVFPGWAVGPRTLGVFLELSPPGG